MGSSARHRLAAGSSCIAAFACAAALAVAGQAGAASYPAGGSDFEDGPQGWTGSETSCTPPAACTASNAHDPAGGNPGGALVTEGGVLVNLVGLFEADGTWTSPPFTVPPGVDVAGATFQYDRRFQAGALVQLEPAVSVAVELLDDTGATATPLLTDEFSDSTAFETRGVGVPGGAVVAGNTYRLRLRSTISSSAASLLLSGTSTVGFDNVSLAVSEAAGGDGDGGDGDGGNGDGGGNATPPPAVSPGVIIVRGPYSDTEIANIVNRFDIDAAKGGGRDGSLVPLHLCTILATSGPDRITGTAGNDVICGLGGDDVISGGAGRDVVDGANGNDRLTGSIGGDLLLGLRGRDRINGAGGRDRVGGGAGPDRLNGGNGPDLVSGSTGNDRVNGAAGNDRLRGLAGRDHLNGGPGRDRLNGGRGHDILRGRSGRDRVVGGPGRDRLVVRDGRRDLAVGGPGRDRAIADRVDRLRRIQQVHRR